MSPNLTLYVRTGCPYCAKVLRAGEELGITFNLKNISDPGVADELVARGGKQQMPYLVDEGAGVEMYESDEIVNYLREHYAKGEEAGAQNSASVTASSQTPQNPAQACPLE